MNHTRRLSALVLTSGLLLSACGGGGSSGSGTSSAGSSPGQVALAAAAYSVPAVVGAASISVERVGGASGTATASYSTVNGTAIAGTDFTGSSGTLAWSDGDSAPKVINVPIATNDPGNKSFAVTLANPVGVALGPTTVATVVITPASSGPNASLAIHVSGNHLVDATGNTVQLRGVNVSGLEAVAIQGWSPSNPWGGSTGTPTPNWNTIKTWGANAVRLPLNEASWLGLNCVDEGGYGVHYVNGVKTPNTPGETVSADPGGNYQAALAASVGEATAAGLYVIIDLHMAAPGNACPTMQNAMADADHASAFWTSMASAFKNYPNVIFELFNEPFLDQVTLGNNAPWPDLLNGGGTLASFLAQTPTSPWFKNVSYNWQNAGMQQMLNAVRAAGATNVILTSTLAYAATMSGWLQYHPTDTLNPSQVGAVWHAYPGGSSYPAQVNCVGLPACSALTMTAVKAILAAGYPVVITEFGDAVGGSGAPLSSTLLPFADTNGINYMAWAWDIWPGTTYYLITDAAGTPTAGYGAYVKSHYLCRAAGTTSCA